MFTVCLSASFIVFVLYCFLLINRRLLIVIVGLFTLDIQTYCAFFDKSTKFCTEVVQPIKNKFGYWAIAQLSPGGLGGHFPKWPPIFFEVLVFSLLLDQLSPNLVEISRIRFRTHILRQNNTRRKKFKMAVAAILDFEKIQPFLQHWTKLHQI